MKHKLAVLLLMLVWFVTLARASAAQSLNAVHTVCIAGCDYVSIQAAVNGALAGDTILILDAVHLEAGVNVTKNLIISGQGQAATIVQADVNPGVAVDRILWIQTGVVATVRDMTLRHGNVNGWGGAVRNSGTATLDNVRLTANTAAVGGGALVNEGVMTIHDSQIQNNSAVQFGGGIYNWTGANLTIDNCTVTGNSAGTGGGLLNNLDAQATILTTTFSANATTTNGGGALNGGDLTVSDSTFSGNTATSRGGGLGNFSADSVLTISNSVVNGNTANGGGGLDNVSGTLTLNQVTVMNNSADQGGGLSNGDRLSVTLGDFSGNTAISIGGGLSNGGQGTISQSQFSDNDAPYAGALLNNPSAILLVEDSQFHGNSASDDGGAVLNGGDLTINTSTFQSNSATGGGAIDNGSGNLTVNNSLFQANLAVLNGGAIENFIGLLTVNNSVFQNNTVSAIGVSGGFGGAIYNTQGTVTVDLSRFSDNEARSTTSGNGWGGALFNQSGVMTVDHSTLNGNSATTFGGGLFNGGSLTLQNSTLFANTASVYGGGLANLRVEPGIGVADVNNVTVTLNGANRGGGAFNGSVGVLNVNNSTFYVNQTSTGGSEFFNATGTLTVRNSIAANQSSNSACYGTISTGGAPNLASDTSCAFSLRADPLLGGLQDNGGPTQTRALLPGSPALDAGDDATCLPTDQRGSPRPRGAACDLGSFEALAYPAVQFESDAYTVSEDVGTLVVTVTLTHAAEQIVTVPYGIEGGSATPGSDYQLVGGTLTFSPGETLHVIQLVIYDDALDEIDETIELALSEPVNASLGDPSTTVITITDNDATPTVYLNSAGYSVDEAAGVLNVTVLLSAPSGQNLSVQYQTWAGTATAGSDYLSAGGVLNFTPGQTERLVTITIIDDALDEADETFSLNLVNPINVNLGDPAQAVVTISDNDAPPQLMFTDANFTIIENEGAAVIQVALDAPSGLSVSVTYTASDGTATAGEDYTAVSGVLTWPPGTVIQTFNVPILDDGLEESAETVMLALSAPVNAGLGAPAEAILTIQDNDQVRHLNFSSLATTVSESAGTVTLQVLLDAPATQTVTVDFATFDGVAKAGSDYVAQNGTLIFNPGQTSRTITVVILNDQRDEPSEAFSVVLSNPVNAQLGPTSGTAVIITDDDPPLNFIFIPIAFRQ